MHAPALPAKQDAQPSKCGPGDPKLGRIAMDASVVGNEAVRRASLSPTHNSNRGDSDVPPFY